MVCVRVYLLLATVNASQPVNEKGVQLPVPRYHCSMFGHRAFSLSGPAAWNSLPDYLRDPTRSVDSSRRNLKTLLVLLVYTAH